MKVSIIMPSLNVVKYIDECMQSVLEQTLSDIEIICVDAGSDDGTWEKLENYAEQDSRIKLIHSEIKSYGYQMNQGIKAAKGDYIGIVETDDYIMPNMFQALYDLIKDTEADFVKSRYVCFFDMKGKRYFVEQKNYAVSKVYEKVIDLKNYEELRLADTNHIWSGLYSRSFLVDNEIWFNETEGASFQDTSFSVLVGMIADCCIYTNSSYYFYRTDRPESSVKSSKKYKCVIDEMDYIYAYLEAHNLNNNINQIKIAQVKLATYSWNMNRLTDASRDMFKDEIKEEMLEFQPRGEFFKCLTNNQLQMVEQLINPEQLKIEEEKRNRDKKKIIDIFTNTQNYKKLIFVGAGNYFRTFLYYQELSGIKIIEDVCDNNKEIQGTYISGYEIKSVEKAVEENAESIWMVASRKYTEELLVQLQALGVLNKNIIGICYLPDPMEFMYEIATQENGDKHE